jgi:hypothetical protein
VLRRVVEPGDEIEGFPEITGMMQPARDRGEITQTDRRVARDVFEDPAAFVLRQVPPQRAFFNGISAARPAPARPSAGRMADKRSFSSRVV